MAFREEARVSYQVGLPLSCYFAPVFCDLVPTTQLCGSSMTAQNIQRSISAAPLQISRQRKRCSQ
jgi:hypothetical protein